MAESATKKQKSPPKIDDGIPPAEDLFSTQPLMALLLQMSFLDDASLEELCRINKKAKAVCNNQDQRYRVYVERFERVFGAEADQLALMKNGLYGTAFHYGIFYKNAVTAREFLMSHIDTDGEVNWDEHEEDILVKQNVFLIFTVLMYRKFPHEALRAFRNTIEIIEETQRDISMFIGADGKIFDGTNFVDALLAIDPNDGIEKLVTEYPYKLKAVIVAYRQAPAHPEWLIVLNRFAHDLFHYEVAPKPDRIAWLAREIDSVGNLPLDSRRLLAQWIYSVVGEVSAADLDWHNRKRRQ